MKKQRFSYWNEILHGSELFEKNIGMMDFAIIEMDLALSKYCLWFWRYSTHTLCSSKNLNKIFF